MGLRIALVVSAILVVAAIACNIAALAVRSWVHWNNGHVRVWLFGSCSKYATIGDICRSYYENTGRPLLFVGMILFNGSPCTSSYQFYNKCADKKLGVKI